MKFKLSRILVSACVFALLMLALAPLDDSLSAAEELQAEDALLDDYTTNEEDAVIDVPDSDFDAPDARDADSDEEHSAQGDDEGEQEDGDAVQEEAEAEDDDGPDSDERAALAAPDASISDYDVLHWDLVEGAIYYSIYVNGVKQVSLNGNVSAYDLNLLNLPSGVFQIQVRAISGAEEFADSALSEAVEFVVAAVADAQTPNPQIATWPAPNQEQWQGWGRGRRGGGCWRWLQFQGS